MNLDNKSISNIYIYIYISIYIYIYIYIVYIYMKCTLNHHSRVMTQHQETVAMASTAESKRVFKSETAQKMKMNECPM